MTLPLLPLDGRVELRGLLGEGGMGEVHRAWDRAVERAVAVKFPRGADGREAERLLLEARLQARVEHPHVVKVHEVGTLGGRACIVFQLVEGRNLAAEAARLPLEVRIDLLAQAARGLHAAHQQGLVHRDVKPGNVLVELGGDAPRALLGDFGLARDEEAGLSRTGLLPGTLDYMSPEQLVGTGRADYRSDVYALGATLYAVVAGAPPFRPTGGKGEDESARLVRRILEEDPPPLSSVSRGTPAEIEVVAIRAMQKRPESRYPSALTLAEDLERFRRGEPILARPPSVRERVSKWRRRNRGISRALETAALVAALSLGFALWSRQASARAEIEAARLGGLAASLEYRIQLEHLAPPHDLRPALAAVRGEVEALRPAAAADRRGAASYAMGKGLGLLGDLDGARRALERAWALGLRTPEVAEELGTTLGRIYQREVRELEGLMEPAARAERIRALQAELLEPARRHLAAGSGSGGALQRAQLALLEGRFELARSEAGRAREAEPARHRAALLESEAWLEEGRQALQDQRPEEAARALAAAVARAEAAADWARSDPAPLALLAEAHALVAHARQRRGLDPTPEAEAAQVVAARAAALDPDSPQLAVASARSHEAQALFADMSGRPSLPLLETAGQLFRRATELAPARHDLWSKLAYNLYTRAAVRLNEGLPAAGELDEGLQAIGRAAALAPRQPEVVFLRMLLRYQQGEALLAEGKEAEEALRLAVEAGEELLRMPGYNLAMTRTVLGLAGVDQGVAAWRAGADPRPHLVRGLASLEEAHRTRPGNPAATGDLLDGLLPAIRLRLAMGDDASAELSRGRAAVEAALAEHPDLVSLRVRRVALASLEAWSRFGRGEDPGVAVAEAERLAAAAPGLPEDADLLGALALVARLSAAWERSRGRDPRARLARAEARLDRLQRIQPRSAGLHAERAECALERALFERSRRRSGAAAARAGLAHVAAALEVDPREARLWLVRARLLGLAGEPARASLEKALALQPLLSSAREAKAAEAELLR